MENDAIPFWEETYQDETPTFSIEPNQTLKEFEHMLGKHASVLDVGCGEGQNALYLARQGWTNIDAFDLSFHGIAKVRQKSQAAGLQLNAFTADLREFLFEKSYDFIMSFGTLHFVSTEDWKAFIFRAKEYTLPGGIHIMQILDLLRN